MIPDVDTLRAIGIGWGDPKRLKDLEDWLDTKKWLTSGEYRTKAPHRTRYNRGMMRNGTVDPWIVLEGRVAFRMRETLRILCMRAAELRGGKFRDSFQSFIVEAIAEKLSREADVTVREVLALEVLAWEVIKDRAPPMPIVKQRKKGGESANKLRSAVERARILWRPTSGRPKYGLMEWNEWEQKKQQPKKRERNNGK
jgi:hypothetical protein